MGTDDEDSVDAAEDEKETIRMCCWRVERDGSFDIMVLIVEEFVFQNDKGFQSALERESIKYDNMCEVDTRLWLLCFVFCVLCSVFSVFFCSR